MKSQFISNGPKNWTVKHFLYWYLIFMHVLMCFYKYGGRKLSRILNFFDLQVGL